MLHSGAIRNNRELVAKGEISLKMIVQHHLDAIEAARDLNAFLDIYATGALARAEAVEARIRRGQAGRLAGALIAVKDIIAIKGQRLTCASKMLADYVSPFSATVIQKLEADDAIIIGKTNMDEFAMGSSTENSAFGAVQNPANPSHVPGGSSGGSAAAVAAGLCSAALGTDTGGSIRQPAAFCGVFGMKPTYGRVSRFGLVAFASSLDQIGPFAGTVADLAAVLQTISGHDSRDSTSAPQDVPDFSATLDAGVSGKTIGLPREYFDAGLQPEIQARIDAFREHLQRGGARLVDVELPLTEYGISAYYVICTAEASSNLARYDGAHYGFRAKDAGDLSEMYTRSRSEGFGAEVKRRIMLGTYVLSSGYYDAYYARALKVRTRIRQEFDRVFSKCDLLLTPTTPTTAFQSGEKTADPLAMYLSDVYTVSANLTGLPAISVPAGTDERGLPIGVQFIAPAFDELSLLQAARFLESSTK